MTALQHFSATRLILLYTMIMKIMLKPPLVGYDSHGKQNANEFEAEMARNENMTTQ
jgi:hypothetical protein